MPKITVGGEEIYHQMHGSTEARPPLVLVHGAAGSHMHWPGSLRRLAGQAIYALDLSGHSKSGGHSRDSVRAYADVVFDFVQTTGLTRIVLAGHSMGGGIAQDFALRYPGYLAGIVLVGTGARLRVAPQILDGILADFEGTTALVTEWSWSPDADASLRREALRRLRQVPASVIHDDYQACDCFDRRHDVPGIAAPALVVCGTADRMTPPKYSEWLAEQLPHARLVLIPGAGHMAMLEQPGPVTAAVAAFLDDIYGAQQDRQ